MKMKNELLILSSILLVAAACKTTETETKPVSWKTQSAYLATVQDPRRFGYSIYETPSGIDYRGGSRLHPNQAEALTMEAEDPLRSVVMMKENFGMDAPVLLDFSTSASWLEFDLAKALNAVPINERDAQLFKIPGEEIPGCPSVVAALRFGQLHVENPLVNVRMATGSLGSLARGIKKPEPKGVIGWEILRKFEQIQLDYTAKKILISTGGTAYMPNPAMVAGKLPLVKYAGACAVRGLVDGKEQLILIDPAGDFEVATDGEVPVASVQLDADMLFSAPAVAKSTGGIRIGARLLKSYKIVIRPQAGLIYFEKPDAGKEK